MNKVQQFKDFAVRYGFKVLQDGDAYRLCAKNTDNRWTRWVSYYPNEDKVSCLGNTDYLNIWLCDTRKDFTPETCLKFIEELNDLFELKGNNKFLVRELIDPEDWQEIAGVKDAYEDKRYSIACSQTVNLLDTTLDDKASLLVDFFWEQKIAMVVDVVDGHLFARDDEGNSWKDAEIYDFALNECLCFNEDGSLANGLAAAEPFVERLKEDAAPYGVSITSIVKPIEAVLSAAEVRSAETGCVEPGKVEFVKE